ncbi:MAG: FHA domain-containing protein, partial [Bacteroidaceae bacterium]|nr:FHA domain-containing protein [Bacteroidaceae bacterium]
IGRKVKGTDLTSPILTVDPSIDSFHCKINVIRNKQGNYVFSLSDAPSNTGTFLNNKILGDTEKANVAHGDIINLGASTIILKEKGKEDEE